MRLETWSGENCYEEHFYYEENVVDTNGDEEDDDDGDTRYAEQRQTQLGVERVRAWAADSLQIQVST